MNANKIRQRWDSLKPAERDAWVDTKVMGNPKYVSEDGEPKRVEPHWAYGPDSEGPFYEGPGYSTDIDAAWEVMSHVQESHPGWRFGLLGGDWHFDHSWQAEFFGHINPSEDYGQRHGKAYMITAPEAICLAALIAVETDR